MGNRKAAAFWKDRWLGESPLCDMLHTQADEEELELKMEHFWEQNVGWKWEIIPSKRMSMTRMVKIEASTLSSEAMAPVILFGCMGKAANSL